MLSLDYTRSATF